MGKYMNIGVLNIYMKNRQIKRLENEVELYKWIVRCGYIDE